MQVRKHSAGSLAGLRPRPVAPAARSSRHALGWPINRHRTPAPPPLVLVCPDLARAVSVRTPTLPSPFPASSGVRHPCRQRGAGAPARARRAGPASRVRRVWTAGAPAPDRGACQHCRPWRLRAGGRHRGTARRRGRLLVPARAADQPRLHSGRAGKQSAAVRGTARARRRCRGAAAELGELRGAGEASRRHAGLRSRRARRGRLLRRRGTGCRGHRSAQQAGPSAPSW